MKIKSLRNIKKIAGKKVLLRADFNVPITKGKINDFTKIVSSLPTIKFLQRYKAKVIIITHLGRPKGRDISLSVSPIANYLSKLLDKKIDLVDDFRDCNSASKIAKMKDGDVVMLENIRFYNDEMNNNIKFAKELANLGDIFINNAFAVSHRKQASLVAIKKYLKVYAGLLLENEILNLNKILKPEFPFLGIVGGVKAETKIKLISKLAKKNRNSKILIGGALANTFLSAYGYEVGKSKIDKNYIKLVKKLKNKQIILPIDAVVKDSKTLKISSKAINKITKNDYIFDVGPETIKLFSAYIKKAKTIVWNGPLGKFEDKKFRNGTVSIARLIASRSRIKAFAVVGGGETVEALKITKMQDYIDWISTGGGAMLAYLAGEDMPGLNRIVK